MPSEFYPNACIDKTQVEAPGERGSYAVGGDTVQWVKMYTWVNKYSYNPYHIIKDSHGCYVQVKVYDYTRYVQYHQGKFIKSWTKG